MSEQKANKKVVAQHQEYNQCVNALKDYTMGDDVLFERLITTLLRTIPENKDKLVKALSGNNYLQIRSVLHTLKPMFVMLDDETSIGISEGIRQEDETQWKKVVTMSQELIERLEGIFQAVQRVEM